MRIERDRIRGIEGFWKKKGGLNGDDFNTLSVCISLWTSVMLCGK